MSKRDNIPQLSVRVLTKCKIFLRIIPNQAQPMLNVIFQIARNCIIRLFMGKIRFS